MSNSFRPVVLDTNAVAALFDAKKPEHQDAKDAYERLLAARAADPSKQAECLVVVPALVVYEVRRGLLKVGSQSMLRHFDQLLRAQAYIAPFDEDTANLAAKEWAALQTAGKAAGELDLLIAATALEVDENIVTADIGFPALPGIRKLRWAEVQTG
jgi:predicted nucleic acid-binding protein